jgi:EF-P beta-lysylation protein EpmB
MHSLPKNPPAESAPAPASPAWQRQWQESFRDSASLLAFLELNPAQLPEKILSEPAFPLRVPRAYAERMRPGDAADPLLRQVLALDSELIEQPGFVSDAVGDEEAQAGPGVLRKYNGRALLVLTGVCAVHCRYCFRREYPYARQAPSRAQWEQIYARLGADASVEEILFSGGDPLSLSDSALRWHWEQALSLPHVRRVRIHTRLPVVLPARVDAAFLALVRDLSARKPLYLVLHINHAREIDAAVVEAARALRAAGAILLNQSVLLRGVNDTVEALEELSRRLLDAGILPYYLHQLDRVRGTHAFEVEEEKGLALIEGLRARMSGYGVPKYVREIRGEKSKTEIKGGRR